MWTVFKIYSYFASLEELACSQKGRGYSFIIKVFKRLCVWITIFLINFRAIFSRQGLVDDNGDLVISLTSFPARINTVWLTIASLGNQTEKVGKIILYLSLDEFPHRFKDLPMTLKRLQKHGLTIVFVEDNLKSHKKYYYSLQDFSDRIVITVDDDLLYPPNTIQRLFDLSKQYPNQVIANRTTKILKQGQDILTYENWKPCTYPSCDTFLVAIGCGGVLYPISFRPIELFNKDLINRLAPLADDLWLKSIQLLHGVKVVQGTFFPHPMTIPRTHESSLMKVNVETLKLNDSQFMNLYLHFNLDRFLI